jgi:hypothetical protein
MPNPPISAALHRALQSAAISPEIFAPIFAAPAPALANDRQSCAGASSSISSSRSSGGGALLFVDCLLRAPTLPQPMQWMACVILPLVTRSCCSSEVAVQLVVTGAAALSVCTASSSSCCRSAVADPARRGRRSRRRQVERRKQSCALAATPRPVPRRGAAHARARFAAECIRVQPRAHRRRRPLALGAGARAVAHESAPYHAGHRRRRRVIVAVIALSRSK